jgi:hypothetical protein
MIQFENNLKREKVGGKICLQCKNDILKTQWFYTLQRQLEKNVLSNTFYLHQNCFDNYQKFIEINYETT